MRTIYRFVFWLCMTGLIHACAWAGQEFLRLSYERAMLAVLIGVVAWNRASIELPKGRFE